MNLLRTNVTNLDFVQLVAQLDAYLTITDGDEHDFYDQYNGLDDIKYVVVLYEDEKALACGAIKAFSDTAMEVKRMYTEPDARGKGYASRILQHLEQWAKELGYAKCVLETGIRQREAVRLYEKCGYTRIPNYGQYAGVANSVCFEKSVL